ncbi:Peroxisome proliferator-activated receptor gamma coactivator 1-beta, partial [Lamprotornis superbus]
YEVSGEEHLYSDFPEIDLSQLDAGDLDSAGCFSELQWGGEHSETDSSQYSTDDSELFQIIDSENEALLAALTETLDDIQGDDMGLAAFPTMEEGDTLNPATTSPAPSPKPTAPVTGGPPPAPECDELSLLKKLLLSPSPPSCEVEGPRDRRASVPQAQSRSCTELHRHLTSSTSCSQTKPPQAPEECPGSGHHPSLGDCTHHEDDSDSSEDSLSSGDSVAALSSLEDGPGSQFSCEGELHSVLELIRYMHTYCLPPRKLPTREPTDTKPQPCSSPFKRAKPDCAPVPGSAQSRPGCAWQAPGSCKKPEASFSILKELLARDLLCDVSKPYRLGKPVYAALARPPGSCSPVPPDGEDASGTCTSRVKTAAGEKGELQQSPEVEVPRELGGPEDDAGKQEGTLGTGKVVRKQDSAAHAVRRSKRLNPELGHWLSFLEPPTEAQCPVLEGFSAEEPAAEVEVGGTAPSAEPQPLCLGSLGDGEVGTESRRCALLEQTGSSLWVHPVSGLWGSAAVVPQKPSKLQVQEWLSPGSVSCPCQVGKALSGHCRDTAPLITCFSPAFQKHPGVSRCPWHKRALQPAQGAVFAEHSELHCWALGSHRELGECHARGREFCVCALELLTPLPFDPAFGKRNFEPMLTVELCGTAGRTGFEFFRFAKYTLGGASFTLNSAWKVQFQPTQPRGHLHPLHTADTGHSLCIATSEHHEQLWGRILGWEEVFRGPCMSQEGMESPLVPAGIRASFLLPQVPLGEAVGATGAALGWGLTPPTTPPYKPAEEDLYKPDIPQEPGKEDGIAPSPGGTGDVAASRKAPRKHPERTELFAHLSRAGGRALPEQQGLLKRPFSRSFGDHDYCQVLKPEPALQRKVLKSWEPPSQVETEHKRRVPAAHYQGLELGKDTGTEMLWKDGVKQLRDQEIRASLTKHFGFLDSALDDEDMVFCKTPEYDTVFEDSGSESGSPGEEDEEEEEEEEEEHGNTKLCLRRNPLSRSSLHFCSRSRSSSGSSCCRSRSPASRRTFRCENGEQCQGGSGHRGQLKKRREKAIGEGRVVYIRNLSSSMSSSELKKRFEVFGEIVECQVLSRTNRGEKYGFITYRYSEHAALSLKNGPSLRKRNEPSFQLSSGGLGRFFWTRYADLDCSTDESSPAPVKSKYETMDFDSLLQEAQLSLHR